MSNLVKHAETEMRLAGLYDKDADYDGLIPDAVMALVKTHSEQSHSGMSSEVTLKIFNLVVNHKALTPLSSNPAEWNALGDGVWQNKRQWSCFSKDGGATWYDVYDRVSAITSRGK
jgi:hypothetical protein